MSQYDIETADALLTRGFRVIPLGYGTKSPAAGVRGWQNLILTHETIPQYFGPEEHYNFGANLGGSSGFIDVDLDCKEAVEVASYYLPRSECRFGRASKPISHYIYQIPGSMAKYVFKDPKGDTNNPDRGVTLLEIRSTGGQTMMPPSMHPSGEQITWVDDGEPTMMDASEIRKAAGRCAAAALLIREWPSLNRHWTALYLAGALAASGWTQEDVLRFLDPVMLAAHDLEVPDRRRAIVDTFERIERGESVKGWVALVEQTGPEIANTLRQFLGIVPERALRACTDEGNAWRLYDRFGDEIRYCPDNQKWYTWDQRHWEMDTSEKIITYTRDMVRNIYKEAFDDALSDDDKKRIGKWAASSQSAGHISAAPTLARTIPELQVRADELDADALVLNCRNGTLDLRTGGLRPFDRTDYLTKLANVEYHPEATSPMWDGYLQAVFGGSQQLIEYVQRVCGYGVTGLTTEDAFFVMWGPPRTGKSTLVNALKVLMGDYSQETRPEVFMTRSGDPVPNEVASLQGVRLSLTTETEDGQRLATSLVKRMTGGDNLRARYLFREFFEFRPQFKIFIATNNRPVIPGSEAATWARVRLIPFTHMFVGGELDKNFRDRLPTEAGTAIFAWLVKGAYEWLHHGLGEPQEVLDATSDYKSDMDTTSIFLEEVCDTSDVNITTSAAALWAAYVSWARARNDHLMIQSQFKQDVQSKGYQQNRTASGLMWRGIKIVSQVVFTDETTPTPGSIMGRPAGYESLFPPQSFGTPPAS